MVNAVEFVIKSYVIACCLGTPLVWLALVIGAEVRDARRESSRGGRRHDLW